VTPTPPKPDLVTKEDGSFEFDRLLPGRYVIFSWHEVYISGHHVETGDRLVARQIVTLSELDVDDLTLSLAPPVDISGTIRTEGTDPDPGLHAEIQLTGTDHPAENVHLVPNKPDGTFLVSAVAPGTYEVKVNKLPAGSYVKSMRYGGQYLADRILDNTSGAAGSLEIILSPDVADLSGTVQNDSVDAPPRVQVTLWAPGIVRNTESSSKGAFRFPDLPPGTYYVIAWEQVDRNLTTIPDFLARFENQATSVTLGPKDRGTVQVKIVKRDAVEAEAGKFR
jgi:hypothetical protein